jgi:hypothetical protein
MDAEELRRRRHAPGTARRRLWRRRQEGHCRGSGLARVAGAGDPGAAQYAAAWGLG